MFYTLIKHALIQDTLSSAEASYGFDLTACLGKNTRGDFPAPPFLSLYTVVYNRGLCRGEIKIRTTNLLKLDLHWPDGKLNLNFILLYFFTVILCVFLIFANRSINIF